MSKKFALDASKIKSLAPDRGSCLVTDRITVDGLPVGYMYREASDNDLDSGWRFFAGDESEEYVGDATNIGLYVVNTIANYDPNIVQYLDAPAGAAYIRDESSDRFVADRR